LITAFGNHHFGGLQNYNVIIGGAAMIFTAIRNPAGIAPTVQPLLQYFGNWLKTARGPQWIAAIKRVTPGALVASVPIVALLWSKATEFRLWFLVMVPLLALFFRGIGLEVYRSMKAKAAKRKGIVIEPPHGAALGSGSLVGEGV
jgi:hypothetical protein